MEQAVHLLLAIIIFPYISILKAKSGKILQIQLVHLITVGIFLIGINKRIERMPVARLTILGKPLVNLLPEGINDLASANKNKRDQGSSAKPG